MRIVPKRKQRDVLPKGSRGLSLLELVIIIFLLSAIVVVAMPSFSGIKGGLEEEARRVASVLRFASDSAAARKAPRAVKFDLKEQTMAYDQEGKLRSYHLKSLHSVELLSRGEVTEGELVVIFNPEGLGDHMSVHLKRKDKALDVQYNPISRRVSIQEPEDRDEKRDGDKDKRAASR